jgi:hypothetical protein
MEPDNFWNPYQGKIISSYSELVKQLDVLFKKTKSDKTTYAWRGMVNADWALHSSLYRRLTLTFQETPDEKNVYSHERKILEAVRKWGLHYSTTGGRLSVLNQLAALQHYGAPTRLIDVTFNPWIAVWFAVEQKKVNGTLVNEDKDCRLFAIDVTGRLINDNPDLNGWEDTLCLPWPETLMSSKAKNDNNKISSSSHNSITIDQWRTQVFAWRPPHYDARIAAQNGGFIFGGVPYSKPNIWYKGIDDDNSKWLIDEVRQSTSLYLRPHHLKPQRGGVSEKKGNAVYTFRISSKAKVEIRKKLEQYFGYNYSTIYPDYTGFSMFGYNDLKSFS